MASPNVVLQNVENTVFAEALLFGTNMLPDDVLFAAAQDLTHSHTMELAELQGPESRTAIGVGVKGEQINLASKFAVVDPRQIALARGISETVLAAIADPLVAPVPTASGVDGTFGIGFAAVAYAYRRKDGSTKTSPVATVDIVAGPSLVGASHIALAAVTPLPADVVSVDWFVSHDVAVSAPLAAALPLYLAANNDGGAITIKDPPSATARPAPVLSSVATKMTMTDLGSLDAIKAFDIKMEGTLDGSNFKRLYYNCVVTKTGDTVSGPREWLMGDIEIKCYGKRDPNNGSRFIYYSNVYSGDRTA